MGSVGEDQREVVRCDTSIRRQTSGNARESGQACTEWTGYVRTHHGKRHPHANKEQPVRTSQRKPPKGRRQTKKGAHLYTNNVPGTCHTDPSWVLPSATTRCA